MAIYLLFYHIFLNDFCNFILNFLIMKLIFSVTMKTKFSKNWFLLICSEIKNIFRMELCVFEFFKYTLSLQLKQGGGAVEVTANRVFFSLNSICNYCIDHESAMFNLWLKLNGLNI